ncbi:MAG TPA: MATE family efflux transporter [Dongiaceae bacterium]|nr:MATE family efflux transporter [Dongiaceae bacterium]
MLASQALRLAYQWVDALWVRGLGVEATAAVTSSIFVVWWVLSLNDIFQMGVVAYTSQLLGAGQRARAGVAAYKGLRASALLGLTGTAMGLLGARAIFRAMGADAALMKSGPAYLSVILSGAPLFMVAETCASIMRASGNTRVPLLFDLAAVGLNAVLSPFLIYGIGPFPRLGVAGAAWATVSAQLTLIVLFLGIAARRHPAFPLARHADGPPVRILGLARVGLPAALIGGLFSVVYLAFARAASQFGPASMAIVGIANRIEALLFMMSVAIGIAGAALVGQNLGADRPERAVATLRTGTVWVLWIGTLLTIVVGVFADRFLSLFTPDADVHRLGVPYLRVLVLCFIATGLEVVTAESVMGSGHTRALSAIYTVFSLMRIPLAFVVPALTHSGVIGIAWVITVTCIVRTILILAWAWRRTWLTGLKRELAAAEAG